MKKQHMYLDFYCCLWKSFLYSIFKYSRKSPILSREEIAWIATVVSCRLRLSCRLYFPLKVKCQRIPRYLIESRCRCSARFHWRVVTRTRYYCRVPIRNAVLTWSMAKSPSRTRYHCPRMPATSPKEPTPQGPYANLCARPRHVRHMHYVSVKIKGESCHKWRYGN